MKIRPGLLAVQVAQADDDLPPAFGGGVDEQEFYRPFTVDEITHDNAQSWPYYKYASVNWEDYALLGTAEIGKAKEAVELSAASEEYRYDLNSEWSDGQSFLELFRSKQVKGFIVVKNSKILICSGQTCTALRP